MVPSLVAVARGLATAAAAACVTWGSLSLRPGILVPAMDVAAGRGGQMVLLCTLFKLTASLDDIVWLMPFVAGQSRTVRAARCAQYVITMTLLAGIVAGIARAGQRVLSDFQPSEFVARLVTGGTLALYSAVLCRQWCSAERGDAAAAGVEGAADLSTVLLDSCREAPTFAGPPDGACVESAAAASNISEGTDAGSDWHSIHSARSIDDCCRTVDGALDVDTAAGRGGGGCHAADDDRGPFRLLGTSLLGAMDDLAMFLSLLLGRACEAHQLTLGVGLGSCLVTCFCLSVSRSRPLVQLLRGVPLFAVVAVFAASMLLGAAPPQAVLPQAASPQPQLVTFAGAAPAQAHDLPGRVDLVDQPSSRPLPALFNDSVTGYVYGHVGSNVNKNNDSVAGYVYDHVDRAVEPQIGRPVDGRVDDRIDDASSHSGYESALAVYLLMGVALLGFGAVPALLACRLDETA